MDDIAKRHDGASEVESDTDEKIEEENPDIDGDVDEILKKIRKDRKRKNKRWIKEEEEEDKRTKKSLRIEIIEVDGDSWKSKPLPHRVVFVDKDSCEEIFRCSPMAKKMEGMEFREFYDSSAFMYVKLPPKSYWCMSNKEKAGKMHNLSVERRMRRSEKEIKGRFEEIWEKENKKLELAMDKLGEE